MIEPVSKQHERRRSKRRQVYNGARLAQSDGTALGICRIIDISRTGAKLETDMAPNLPEHFSLLLSYDGRLRRQCVVVWRSETSIGVDFVPENAAPKISPSVAKQIQKA